MSDLLSALKGRNALEKDLIHERYAAVIVAEIDNLPDFRKEYGDRATSDLLKEVAGFLQRFADAHAYTLYRIPGDYFILRDHESFAIHTKYEDDISDFQRELKRLRIRCSSGDEEIEVAMTLGLSMERKDALKKAQMALQYARERRLRVIAYSPMIENASSL